MKWILSILLCFVVLCRSEKGELPKRSAHVHDKKEHERRPHHSRLSNEEQMKNPLGERIELIQLMVLNRHGHRSPNGPYWDYCPNDRYNARKYDVVAGQLTRIGFVEEFKFGQYMHNKYNDFIGSTFDPQLHYLRAVAEPRTMQSALIAAQGMFPAGYGPAGIYPNRPQYVPIYSDQEGHEYLLDSFPCEEITERDVRLYMAGRGAAVMEEPKNAAALEKIRHLCGTPLNLWEESDKDLIVKILVDGVIFNHDYGLNVLNGKVGHKLLFTLRNLSNVLLHNKLYGTDEQKTYSSVNFPKELLHRFWLSTKHPGVATTMTDSGVPSWHTFNRFTYYCGHREEIYGVAHFFDMYYHVPGYPPMELPTGSTFIFGLYNGTNKAHNTTEYWVKSTLWTPNHGEFNLPMRGCANAHLCRLEEVYKIYDTRTSRTGTWDKLCKYKLPPRDTARSGGKNYSTRY